MTFHCRSVPLGSDGEHLYEEANEHQLEISALECYAAPTWLAVSTFLFAVSMGLAAGYWLEKAELTATASEETAWAFLAVGLAFAATVFVRTFKAEMRMRFTLKVLQDRGCSWSGFEIIPAERLSSFQTRGGLSVRKVQLALPGKRP